MGRLGKKTEIEIIKLYLTNLSGNFHLRQIARNLDMDHTSVRPYLDSLKTKGIIKERKADEALEVTFSLEEDEYYDWTVTAAYFARYFALTGLLRRCGIVSENHACAITILEEIFVNRGELESDLLDSIKRGKNSRIEKQYGIVDTDRASATRQREDAIEFVTDLQSYLANLTDDKVEKIRKFFKKFLL